MVGVILIAALAVIGAAIFIGAYLRNMKDTTSNDAALCAGIDIWVKTCYYYPASTVLPGGQQQLGVNGIYFLVERGAGDGAIKDLRFSVTDLNSGETHSERPVNFTGATYHITTEYFKLVEHSTIEAVVIPITYLPNEVRVSPVVGDSNTVCTPADRPLKCILIN